MPLIVWGMQVLCRTVSFVVKSTTLKCMLNTETFDTFSNPWDIFELYRKEDIDSLRNEFNVTQLHFIATDGYTNHMRETVDRMEDRMYKLYLKYYLAVCERQDMVGYSHHTLDIFRKEESAF